MKNTIVIVHPFTSDKVLYSQIKAHGYTIVTLVTPLDMVWVKHCQETIDKFGDHLINVDGVAEVDIVELEQLCQQHNLHIVGVINAFDYSLEYADALAKHFVGIDLDLTFSKIRCDKFLVNNALANANINHIKSILLSNERPFKDAINELKTLNFPVVVKPASLSAARNHVMLAADFSALTAIVKEIGQAKNIFTNEIISDIVVQEYIEGDEFFVNSVSLNGKHHVGGVFKYKKNDAKFVGIWSLDGSEDNVVKSLLKYNLECLTALKVNYGMTHNEFIIDKHGKPYLIEMNNRLAGVEVPRYSNTCYNSDEVSIFLDLLENKPIKNFNLHNISAYACLPYLSNFTNPDATQLDLSDVTSQIELVTFRPGVVNAIEKANLFIKVSAALWLSNNDQAVVERDASLLLTREEQGTLFI